MWSHRVKGKLMTNNCQRPELCMLSETCVPCAICPNAKENADDRLALTACSGWVGKLTHDRSGYSDWGWLRDEAGDLIIIVKTPPMDDEEINKHRRAGTDPAQARVDAVLAAINGQNDRAHATGTNTKNEDDN